MTIVRDLKSNGHTILTVKTDSGDFVLDNLVRRDPRLERHRLSLVKRQSQPTPNMWVSINQRGGVPKTSANIAHLTE